MLDETKPPPLAPLCPSCQSPMAASDGQYCPACESPPPEAEATPSRAPMCIVCGYDLQGLTRTGKCPECGTPAEQSYLPDLLANRSPTYLRQLRSGLSWVLNGILAWFITVIGGMFVGVVATGAGLASTRSIELSLQLLGVACSAAILFGWWRLTTPDPGKLDSQFDLQSRRVIRVAVIVQASIALLQFAVSASTHSTPAVGTLMFLWLAALGVVSTVAWITQFFAAMLYVRWLARRVPDPKLHNKAKRFMWLGPLLNTVGILLFMLGPLIALVMYWNMLDKLRKHIKQMLASNPPRPASA